MKRTKKLISILLAALMIFAIMPMAVSAATVEPTANWGADANGVYHITNVNDLFAFAAKVNTDKHFFTGETVSLETDIDLKDVKWTTIGSNKTECYFDGTFDGNGHAIKNLSMSGTKSSDYIGFFGFIKNATIKNLRIENAYVNASVASDYSAVVCARAYGNCLFENVYAQGENAGSFQRTAGFLGYLTTGVSATFVNCVSDVDFTGGAKRTSGFLTQIQVTSSATFTDCAFIGSIKNAGAWSSGFTGLTTDSVDMTRCISFADISTADAEGIGAFVFLDHQNNKNIVGGTEEVHAYFEDCYTASNDGIRAVETYTGRDFPYTLTIKYNGEQVYNKASTKDSKLESDRDNIEAATQYITDLTADNFAKLCPALAASGKWAVTTQTVEYSAGKTVTKILPAAVAEMIDAPINAGTPNGTKYLQTRQNGDKYDIRFVGMVNIDDLAEYESIGFKAVVKVKDTGAVIKSETVSGDRVYKTIKADGVDVSAESLGSKHVSVFQISGFKADTVYEISVLSFAKKADGTCVYDFNGAFTLTVNNAQIVD